MKNSLSKTGLSMSQAQSISNLCNQRAREIENYLTGINNATKKVVINGETYEETVGKPIPKNIVDLLKEKAKLHATQAFLMENLKAKDILLKQLKHKEFEYNVLPPSSPEYIEPIIESPVEENWGFEQLSLAESCEYLEVEAYAAHIGQFIHKGGILDKLRNELPKIKTLEFITIKDGEKTPVKVIAHHTPENLHSLHEELAMIHRDSESRVNYFKAKIKNLVTLENARIANTNAIEQGRVNAENNQLRNTYTSALKEWNTNREKARFEFEAARQKEIQEVAAMRILVDKRFKDVVDMYMQNTNL